MKKSYWIPYNRLNKNVLSRRQFLLKVVGTTISVGSGQSLTMATTTEAPQPKMLVKKVADAVLRDFPTPPQFNWGEGTMLTGMMRAHELTKDERYLEFVRKFGDYHHKRGIGGTLKKRGYCGHW